MIRNFIDKSRKNVALIVLILFYYFLLNCFVKNIVLADNSVNNTENITGVSVGNDNGIDNTKNKLNGKKQDDLKNIVSRNDFDIIANVDKIAITKYDLNNFILMMKNSGKTGDKSKKNNKIIGNREYNEYLENYINLLKKRVIAEKSGINLTPEEKNNLWNMFSKNLNTTLGIEEYCKKNNLDEDFVVGFLEANFLWYKYVDTFLKQNITVDKETIDSVLEFVMKEQYIVRYNLAEIVLYFNNKEQKETVLNRLNNVYKSIDLKNFGITAFSVSQASSSKNNGLLGWLYESELNEEVSSKLVNARKNSIVKPFCVGEESGACFIFKINDKEKNVEISENERNSIGQFIEKKILEEKIKNVIYTAKINVMIK